MTYTIPLTTRRSSTRGTPCDSGKNGDIRAITAVANLHGRVPNNEPDEDSHGSKADAEFLRDLVDREIGNFE